MSAKRIILETIENPADIDESTLTYPRDKFQFISVDKLEKCDMYDAVTNHGRTYHYHTPDTRIFITARCKKCGAVRQYVDRPQMFCNSGPCNKQWQDLTGQYIGGLTVLDCSFGAYGKDDIQRWYWRCVCDCGTICYKEQHDLIHKRIRGCPTCARKWHADKLRKPLEEVGWNRIWNGITGGAAARGYTFALTFEQVKMLCSQPCYYCGSEPVMTKYGFAKNGIDRYDNTKGYSMDNCVPCCKRCNTMKMDLNADGWFAHMERILTHCRERSTTIPQGSTPKQAETDSDQKEEQTQPSDTPDVDQLELAF